MDYTPILFPIEEYRTAQQIKTADSLGAVRYNQYLQEEQQLAKSGYYQDSSVQYLPYVIFGALFLVAFIYVVATISRSLHFISDTKSPQLDKPCMQLTYAQMMQGRFAECKNTDRNTGLTVGKSYEILIVRQISNSRYFYLVHDDNGNRVLVNSTSFKEPIK